MGPADSTLKENAALSHKKSGVYAGVSAAGMINYFIRIVPIMKQNFGKIACRTSPQKIVNSGASRVGRRNFVTFSILDIAVTVLRLRKSIELRLIIFAILAE